MTEISDPPVEQPAWRQRAVMRSLGAAHSRAEQQIDQFLDAAFALIDERGAADFTIREVSERCDQSIRRFYQYFDGKDELLLALFEVSVLEQTDDLRRTVDEQTEPLARLRVFTIRLYEWCEPADSTDKPGTHTYRPIADFAVQLSTWCIPRGSGDGADLAPPARAARRRRRGGGGAGRLRAPSRAAREATGDVQLVPEPR